MCSRPQVGSDDKIAWYENDGRQTFTTHTITTSCRMVHSSAYAADVDGDGDMDVLSASYEDDKIAWYENDGQADLHQPFYHSPLQMMAAFRLMPPMWTGTGTWMCSRPHGNDDTKSPGMKTC
jgi:hypothetical protein